MKYQKLLFLLILIFLVQFSSLFGVVVGNPASPNMYFDGVFIEGKRKFSIRTGYVSDYIYHAEFEEEFIKQGEDKADIEDIEFSTFGAHFVLNFFNRWDIYTILGGTKFQVDDQIYAPRRFSWVVGTKATILSFGKLRFGGDLKYFSTDVKPHYYIYEDMAIRIITPFSMDYSELQAFLGFSYEISHFFPYIGATYLDAKLEPKPRIGLIHVMGEVQEFLASNVKNKNKWGVVFGVSLISSKKLSLNAEARFIDQNAANISGEFRF